jgi:hypothetical protein
MLLTLLGCGGATVNTTKDPALIPRDGTYAWGPQLEGQAAPDPTPANVRLRGRVLAAMDAALAERGYRKVDEARATFIARYSIGIRTTMNDVRVQSPNFEPVPLTRCGADGCWRGWETGYGSGNDPQFATQASRRAGVVLELVDRVSEQVAWQATFDDDVTGRAPTDERIHAAVARLMRDLPRVR